MELPYAVQRGIEPARLLETIPANRRDWTRSSSWFLNDDMNSFKTCLTGPTISQCGGMVSFLKIVAALAIIAICQIAASYFMYGPELGVIALLLPLVVSSPIYGKTLYWLLPKQLSQVKRTLLIITLAVALPTAAYWVSVALVIKQFGKWSAMPIFRASAWICVALMEGIMWLGLSTQSTLRVYGQNF
jgi:hypothetical protein